MEKGVIQKSMHVTVVLMQITQIYKSIYSIIENNNSDTNTIDDCTPVSLTRLAAQSLHRLHRHRDDY